MESNGCKDLTDPIELQNLAYFDRGGLIQVNKLMPTGTVSLHERHFNSLCLSGPWCIN